MDSYRTHQALARYVLEESYVLGIRCEPGTVEFQMDLLVPGSAAGGWQAARWDCGVIALEGVTSVTWTDQGAPPAINPGGKVDYGSFDGVFWEDDRFAFYGDFGCVAVTARRCDIRVEKAASDG